MKFSYLAYNIWYRRNKVVFGDLCRKNEQVVEYSTKAVVEYGLYAQNVYGGRRATTLPPSKLCVPSTEGCIKINSDSSVTEDGWVGLGVMARDHKREVLFAASR